VKHATAGEKIGDEVNRSKHNKLTIDYTSISDEAAPVLRF
jgi:hypothetical protein